MKKAIIILIVIFWMPTLSAQRIDVKFYKPRHLVLDNNYEIQVSDAVSKAGYLKFKIIIINRSSQPLIYKPDDMDIRIGELLYKSKGAMVYLDRHATISKVITIKGSNLMTDTFLIENAGLYVEAVSAKPIIPPDFEIPGATELRDSQVYISVKSLKRMNKQTYIKFNMSYSGSGILKIEPGKGRLLVPKGSEHNPKTALPYHIYMDKWTEEKSFSFYFTLPSHIVDLQSDPLVIEWKDMFSQIELSPLNFDKMPIVLDKLKTKKENR